MERREEVKNGARLVLGAALAAWGTASFLAPAKLSSGGVATLGTVLLYLFRVPLSVTVVGVNLVLLLLGRRILGKKAVVRTLWGILLLSLFLEGFSRMPPLTGDAVFSSVCGGALSGLGVGLTILGGGSTGGTDLAALMLKKRFPHVPAALLILWQDLLVIALSALVFRSASVGFYSGIAMVFSAKASAWVMEPGARAKMLLVVTENGSSAQKILQENFRRGVTLLWGKGGFSGEGRTVLFSVLSPKEAPLAMAEVRREDPKSFAVMCDVREVSGEGFRPPLF